MAHLHGLSIVHGDLKPGNVLLDGDGHPLISDWGLSRESLGFTATHAAATSGGHSVGWAAPEVLAGRKTSFGSDM